MRLLNSSTSLTKCLTKLYDNPSDTNYTLNTIYCYTLCCSEGCCTWYITLCVYASFVIILVSFWLLMVECLHKYKGTEKNVLVASGSKSRNYGSNKSNTQVTLHILPTLMLAHVVPKNAKPQPRKTNF